MASQQADPVLKQRAAVHRRRSPWCESSGSFNSAQARSPTATVTCDASAGAHMDSAASTRHLIDSTARYSRRIEVDNRKLAWGYHG